MSRCVQPVVIGTGGENGRHAPRMQALSQIPYDEASGCWAAARMGAPFSGGSPWPTTVPDFMSKPTTLGWTLLSTEVSSSTLWSTYAASPWDLRNLANYTIGSLIHTGRLKDHLTATTSTSR